MCLFMRCSCLCDLAIMFIVIFRIVIKRKIERKKRTHQLYNRPFFNLVFYQHFKRRPRNIPTQTVLKLSHQYRIYFVVHIHIQSSTGISIPHLFKITICNLYNEFVYVILNYLFLVHFLRIFDEILPIIRMFIV